MKKVSLTNEGITPESITNHISSEDLAEFRKNLREMMDFHFLFCSQNCLNAEPASCAFRSIDSLLELIQEYQQSQVPISQSNPISPN